MNQKYDVIIIGAGPGGIFSAYELTRLCPDKKIAVFESGHPLGLFPSKPEAPRVIISNAIMIGMYDNLEDWEVAEEMGVANYGQMTAGGWMYIGPQGIVHGTFNTILNAGRKELGVPEDGDLAGHTFVSSGLGGMSGAQPKAANIANAVGIFAEVDYSRIETRHDQGWVDVIMDDIDEIFKLANEKVASGRAAGSVVPPKLMRPGTLSR